MGLPSLHTVISAVHVAHVIGHDRARANDAYESYWRRATGGAFSPSDLKMGEDLLISCGLMELQDDVLVVNRELEGLLQGDPAEFILWLCQRSIDWSTVQPWSDEFISELSNLIPDEDKRRELLSGHRRQFDDELLRVIGGIGEELVMVESRAELERLGRQDLASRVRQVSLYNDAAGYDILAPCTDGSVRLLEVKATVRTTNPIVIHLTRNETEVGRQRREWSLVICVVNSVEDRSGEIVGWIPYSSLARRLPIDAEGGKWEVATVSVAKEELVLGIPSAIP
jgi:hypothetical protein